MSPEGDVGVELSGEGASGSAPGGFRNSKEEWRVQGTVADEKGRDHRASHC